MLPTRITYDPDGDILYVTFGQPTAATGYQLSDQLLLRVSPQAQTVAGLTIFNYSIHARTATSYRFQVSKRLTRISLRSYKFFTLLRSLIFSMSPKVQQDSPPLSFTPRYKKRSPDKAIINFTFRPLPKAYSQRPIASFVAF